ncbi:hypothetical protein ACHAXR_004909 [Thalassiosira sp. AJA248-18]
MPRSSVSKTSSSSLNADHHGRNIVILSHNVSNDVASGYFDVNTLLTGRIDVLARCVNSALWISNGIRKDTSVFLMLFPHNVTIEVRGQEVTGLNPDERTMALCLQRTLLSGNTNSLLQLEWLREKDLKPPDTVNPHKPGSYSKSEKKSFRVVRKHREAMIRRIYRSLNDAGERSDDAPNGFILHTNDSLEERLRLWKSEGGVTNTFMMDELGDPLANVLASRNNKCEQHNNSDGSTTTTIILADQMGYSACDESMLAENDDVTKVSLGPISLLTSQCITITHNLLDIQSAVEA